MAEYIIGRAILKLRDGLLNYLSSFKGETEHSHMFYVDDLVIFYNAYNKGISNLLELVDAYGQVSGQIVRQEKSNVFFRKLIIRRDVIPELMGTPIGYSIHLFGSSYLQRITKKFIFQEDCG